MLNGNGILSTVLPVRMEITGHSSIIIALVSSAYFIGLLAGAVHSHVIIDSVGHVRAYSGFAGFSAALCLTFALLNHPAAWIIMRLLGGYCSAGLFVTQESWINCIVSNRNRGRALAMYMITVFMGLGISQLLLGLFDPYGFEIFLMGAIMYSCSLVPLSLVVSETPSVEAPELIGFRKLYRLSPLGVAGCFASGLMMGPFYGLAPAYVLQTGSLFSVPVFMSTVIFSGMLLQIPLGRISDGIDRRIVLIVSLSAFSAASFFILRASTLPSWCLLAGSAVFGGFGFVIYPLSVAHANDSLNPSQVVGASGVLLLAYSTGAATGPLIAGLLMEMTTVHALFPVTGSIAAITAMYGIYRMIIISPPDPCKKSDFVPLPRTSPHAAQMDPRAG